MVDGHTGDEVDQLVLPKKLRGVALSLAHENPTAGHMGEKATLYWLLTRFFWPGIFQETKVFCESCKACQFTQPKGPPRRRVIPLPIMAVSFERIPMDLMGPLPKEAG